MHEGWRELISEDQLVEIVNKTREPESKGILIFKHSTRCSISAMAFQRLERQWDSNLPTLYYLDLLKHRNVSNLAASLLGVQHESPQILLVQQGKCVFNASHGAVSVNNLKQALSGS